MAVATRDLEQRYVRGDGVDRRGPIGPSARTRRARTRSVALLAVLAPLMALAAGALPGMGGADTTAVAATGAARPAPLVVVVAAGDTVWGLAARHAPAGSDVRRYVAEVLNHNDVESSVLRPGAVLELPRG